VLTTVLLDFSASYAWFEVSALFYYLHIQFSGKVDCIMNLANRVFMVN